MAELRTERLESLTSLRFFFLGCVILHHSQGVFPCLQNLTGQFNLSQATSFFFVLSGFVLAYSYREEPAQSSAKYYLSRIARIWPTHIFALILLMVLLPDVFRLSNKNLNPFLSNLLLIQSWIPSRNFFFSFNAASWTCSTLFGLYLLFPFLVKSARQNLLIVTIGAAVPVLVSIYICNLLGLPESTDSGWSQLGFIYVHPSSRLLEFVIGISAGILRLRLAERMKMGSRLASMIELCSLALLLLLSWNNQWIRASSISWASNAGSLWLSNCGVPVLPCALLITIFSLKAGVVSYLVTNKLTLLLGEISLSMYMLHSVFLAHHAVRYPSQNGIGDAVLLGLSLLLCSWLCTRYIEKPMRNVFMKAAVLFDASDKTLNQQPLLK